MQKTADKSLTATCSTRRMTKKNSNYPTTNSHATSISQLMQEVQETSNQSMLNQFDRLLEQMATLLAANQAHNPQQCSARSHSGESGQLT